MEYYSAMKKDNLSFATIWMDFKGIMLSKISQKDIDKYFMTSLTCGI